MRKYADCLVHRVLTAALDLAEPPARTPDELSQLANFCNGQTGRRFQLAALLQNYLQEGQEHQKRLPPSRTIGQHLLELVLITTGHVCKVSYKQLAKVADLKLTEDTKPFRHCMLLPKYRKIGPAELRLFSKVRVTVQLVKEVVTVTSVPPPLAQMQSKESSVEARAADFGSKKESTKMIPSSF
ncbi:hypothetical protein quinque_008804 [Culex quinquefasciatus]